MITKKRSASSLDLSSWIDSRQSQGQYFFTREQVLEGLQATDAAFSNASVRLARKKRIARIYRSFYIIIPLEYSASGTLPAEWFIDDLMNYIGKPYYVGLLSAAMLQGAAHQQPQEFHVVTTAPLRKIEVRNLSIRFFKKKNFVATHTTQIKVQTGFISVSTPESTALDLVCYAKQIGGLDRALTVLQELGEGIHAEKLAEAAAAGNNLAYAQRLGWLLEEAGFKNATNKLAEWVSKKRPLPAKLEPSLPIRGAHKDERWQLLINTKIEGDL